jgi:hypothetical protein
MADVSDKTLAEWALEVKDDVNPVSWLVYGYSGKSKITPRVKGTGEAAEYWEDFRAHLSDDELLFALVRIVMGDAESRRPKFVFIIWLGKNVGVMKKARVGMEKNDVKRVVGAIHLEIETDDTGEIELDAVKKQLKKSMGADCAPQLPFFAVSLCATRALLIRCDWLLAQTTWAPTVALPAVRRATPTKQRVRRSSTPASSRLSKLTPPRHTKGGTPSKFRGG